MDFNSHVQNLFDWTEKHPGLGGWVGAVGALLAIFVTWIIARREYNRAKKQARDRRLAEIDLITKIIGDFEAQIQRYKALGPDAPEAVSFDNVHMNDSEWHSMRDLAFLPVMHWPTLEDIRRVQAVLVRVHQFYENGWDDERK